MKATDPYLFPYPECEPPLTKDSSDIAQMRDLAVAIDSKVTELFTFADDEFISPDACRVTAPSAGVVGSETYAAFNTVTFDNTPGAVMGNLPNGILIRQSGFYFVTGYINTSSSSDLSRSVIVVDGIGDVINEGISVGAGLAGSHMMATGVIPINAGARIRLRLQIGVASATFSAASLAAVRITGA